MSAIIKCREIEMEESERSPNRFSLMTLLGIIIALLLACIMNELGVFEVDRITIWTCFALASLFFAAAAYLVLNKVCVEYPGTKYILITMILLISLAVNVFLNINVVLLTVLPMFVATNYRSKKISIIAVVGSAVCCILAPILAWWLKAWSLNIMLGYLETTCHVSVVGLGDEAISSGKAIGNLLLYLSLPQLMMLGVFGFITMSITRNSINGMKNRTKVLQLSENLGQELNHIATMQDRILMSMADIIESRDDNTGGHVKRTSEVVRILVEAMRADPEQHLSDYFCGAVIKAAPLHDIGKIAVDDAILRKTGALTPQERDKMKCHATKGAELIHNVLDGVEEEQFVQIASNIAMYHHERFDGTGYPQQLKGEQIPLEARIMAVADIYDALVSKRSYKEPVSSGDAFAQMEALMGSQFDPQLERYFLGAREEIEKFYKE